MKRGRFFVQTILVRKSTLPRKHTSPDHNNQALQRNVTYGESISPNRRGLFAVLDYRCNAGETLGKHERVYR
jgi:hypothetical protein